MVMPFMIGQCCINQIVTPPGGGSGGPGGGSGGSGGGGGGSVSSSGLNELIPFTNVITLPIVWNAARIARFGLAPVIDTYILGTDGIYRKTTVEIISDDDLNPTLFTIDPGGLATGFAVIT